MRICETCGKKFFDTDPPPDVCPDCGNRDEWEDIGEEEYAARNDIKIQRIGFQEKTLTDEEYERLMKLGAKGFSDQEFIRSWYLYFDEINKSNKKSLDSLINSVFCLMKAGSVRQYFFSERKFTETVHEKISALLEFAPDNLEAQEFRAELWIKQANETRDYNEKQNLLEHAYTTLLQIHGRRKDDLETKFSMAEILLDLDDRERDAVKLLEDILASPIQKSLTLVAKIHSKLATVYYNSQEFEKIYGLATTDKIFDTNDPTFGLIFAQLEFMNGNLKSSFYVCKWLLHHHYSESRLWFLLSEIFGKLGNKNYAELALSKGKEMQVWIDQIDYLIKRRDDRFDFNDSEGYEDTLDFYEYVSEQAFSKDKMREHMEKMIKLAPLDDSKSADQDKIMELPYEKRSFEKILAELKAEDDYFTNLEQEMKLEDYSYRQNSFVDEDDASNVEDASEVEDAEEVEDKEDDYMVEQLEKYGLTEEEISVYQDLPAD